MQTRLLPWAVLTAACLLTICRAESPEASWQPGPPPPAEIGLHITTTNQFRFDWPVVKGATHYHLQHRPEQQHSYSNLAANITVATQNFLLEAPLYGRLSTHYRLLACNTAGCSASNVITLKINPAQLLADPGFTANAADLFGYALSLSEDGTLLAVGSPTSPPRLATVDTRLPTRLAGGSTRVFTLIQGNWKETAVVRPEPDRVVNWFGYSVKLNAEGGLLAVGSYDTAAWQGKAALHLYAQQEDASWRSPRGVPPESWTAPGFPAIPVSLDDSGKTLAVGLRYELMNQPVQGSAPSGSYLTAVTRAVYLFNRSAERWSSLTEVWPNASVNDEHFGYSVGLSGDGQVLAVGAPGQADTEGSVYLFGRTATNGWKQQGYLSGKQIPAGKVFGSAVSLNGDGSVLAVAGFEQGGDGRKSGAVYLYVNDQVLGWQQNARLTATRTAVARPD